MANFLSKLIPQLTRAVVTEEVPASERRADGRGTRSRPAKRATLHLDDAPPGEAVFRVAAIPSALRWSA